MGPTGAGRTLTSTRRYAPGSRSSHDWIRASSTSRFARLRGDLEDGTWHRRNATLLDLHQLDLGYRLVVAGGFVQGPDETEVELDLAARGGVVKRGGSGETGAASAPTPPMALDGGEVGAQEDTDLSAAGTLSGVLRALLLLVVVACAAEAILLLERAGSYLTGLKLVAVVVLGVTPRR